nr:DUF1648 domain-containing protein [uncultured Cellulosilyticum sp.]
MNIALWTTLFTYILIYLAFIYNPKLSPLHCYFGVYMPDAFQHSNEGKIIFKRFFVQSTLLLVLSLVVSLPLIFTRYFTTGLFSLIMLVQLILYFVFYILAHQKVRAVKETLPKADGALAKMVIDTDFIALKVHLRKRYLYLYIVPLAITLLTALYLFGNYSTLPAQIPTHWNYLGQADSWSDKSLFSVGGTVLSQLFFIVILAFCSHSQWRARSKGNQNSKTFKEGHLKYLKAASLSFYVLTLSFVLFMAFNAYAMVNGTALNVIAISFMACFPFMTLLYLLYAYFKYERSSLHATKDSLQHLPEDDDQYWLLGFLYNNPNDPAFFVEKRYGLGWTLNIGSTVGKIIGIITLLILIMSIGISLFTSVPF